MNILLVEDDESISFLYKRQLDKAGFATDVAMTGAQTLQTIGATTYDLILLDILLPDANGIDLLKKIKQTGLNKQTPVILLTNVGQESVIQEAIANGATDCFIKASYTPNQLVEKINQLFPQTLPTPETQTS